LAALQPNVLLPAFTSLLGLAFAGVLLARFFTRRQPYLLVWCIGLLWYALAAGTEALGGQLGWTAPLYRAWYITGAIGVAAYLGTGSLYLHRDSAFGSLAVVCVLAGSPPALATGHVVIGLLCLAAALLLTTILTWRPTWFAHTVVLLLVVATVLADYQILNAPIDLSLLPSSPDQVVSGQAFDAETRSLTPPFNISGALVLVLGAVMSAVYYRRTHAFPNRVKSNVLIAVGAFIPSLASGLTRFGITSLFFLGELLGLLCILAGFLLASVPQPLPRSPKAPAPLPTSRF
jgi:hypothetical protein